MLDAVVLMGGSSVPIWGGVNVRGFGAKGDGTDDTAAFQRAIDAYPSGKVQLRVPYGTYKITDTLTISKDRIEIVGDGKQRSIINFVPSSAKSCFKFAAGASMLTQCAVSCLGFSGNNAQTKTAIEAVDTSELRINDVAMYPWTGGSSIGIRLRGRELTHISDCSINADIPISIGVNPNNGISGDHYHLHDLYLLPASTQRGVTIDDGCNITNFLWDGENSVAGGVGILYWSDTTTTQSALNFVIKNIRGEQMTAGSTYLIYISHNYALYGAKFENIYGGLGINGVYLRRVSSAQFEVFQYIDTAKEAFNADTTCNNIGFWNCLWQSGSTASMGSLIQQLSLYKSASGSPLPDTGYYVSSAIPIKLGANLQLMSVLFASVGTPANGTIVYVSDGTAASNPLTGGGTGCFAIRQNGAWKGL